MGFNESKKLAEAHEKAKRITKNLKKELATNTSTEVKKLLIEDAFNEIIGSDVLYGDTLKIIKDHYDYLENENGTLKELNKKLTKELHTLQDKHKELKNELDKIVESKRKLNEEIEAKNQESNTLKSELKSLEQRLKKAKMREAMLVSWFRIETLNTDYNDIEEKKPRRQKKYTENIEIGKNKVKVPRLDLTVIHKDNIDRKNSVIDKKNEGKQ